MSDPEKLALAQMRIAAQGRLCPFCMTAVETTQFRDELSLKEYYISGLCQNCQDETFGNGHNT